LKQSVALLLVFLPLTLSYSQDLKVREEAVRLLERANAVSSSPKLPDLERLDSFRAFSDEGAKDGSFSRVVIQGIGRREEYRFGEFDLLNVWTQKQVAVAGTPHVMPAELINVLRITPIYLLRFDGQDVIRHVSPSEVHGRAAQCIDFDTIHGERTENNEICVDAENGTLLLEKVNGETVENSDFFSFADALFPGKIVYSSGSVPRVEITQTMTALSGNDANLLAPPPNSSMHRICTTYRRPFGLSMPQPKPGNGGGNSDIFIRGMAGVDGRLYDAIIQGSDRPDLNAEAIQIANQWTFTPAMCDGHPDAHEVDFILQFQGR
jgi:hypothetical protein